MRTNHNGTPDPVRVNAHPTALETSRVVQGAHPTQPTVGCAFMRTNQNGTPDPVRVNAHPTGRYLPLRAGSVRHNRP